MGDRWCLAVEPHSNLNVATVYASPRVRVHQPTGPSSAACQSCNRCLHLQTVVRPSQPPFFCLGVGLGVVMVMSTSRSVLLTARGLGRMPINAWLTLTGRGGHHGSALFQPPGRASRWPAHACARHFRLWLLRRVRALHQTSVSSFHPPIPGTMPARSLTGLTTCVRPLR